MVKSEDDVRLALGFASSKGVPFLIIGGGSNLLVGDGEFPGLVIRMAVRGVREDASSDDVRIEAGAGESWDDLVGLCVGRGYWGMENLSLIPGTVGASPIQNIGAYGCEAKDIIESVRVIDSATGEARTLSNAECLFGYRDSLFKGPEGRGLIVTGVTFRLSKRARPNLSYKDLKDYFSSMEKGAHEPTLADIRAAVISIRQSKFPDLGSFGTAGSFWKNPILSAEAFSSFKIDHPLAPSYPQPDGSVKVPLAWVLDAVCGLKGYAKGPVHLFRNQPLVLTAEFGATSAEIDAFARGIEAVVRAKTGIIIEREVNSVLC